MRIEQHKTQPLTTNVLSDDFENLLADSRLSAHNERNDRGSSPRQANRQSRDGGNREWGNRVQFGHQGRRPEEPLRHGSL